ncbi:MAG: hypothetical protein AAFX39_13635 [Pseudomonadota bacterium]
MPTLFRLLAIIGLLVGLVYGAMYAIVISVEPMPRTVTERLDLMPREAADANANDARAEDASGDTAAD